MRDDKRAARMREIEAHAYALFADLGFEGTSMLAVAKRAKASNETLYRWYGDKAGLFESMVRANAVKVQELLTETMQGKAVTIAPMEALAKVAPVLLEMLLSEQAIALNRAAASDPSGALGHKLAQAGRDTVLPLIEDLLRSAVQSGVITAPKDGDIGPLFVALLVGDQQIRRVIGTLDAPSSQEVATQATRALDRFVTLCAPPSAGRGL